MDKNRQFTLSDERIVLRAPEPIDVDTLYKWENDTSLWSTGVTLAPYSRKQLWDYIDNYDGDIFAAKQLRFMIDLKNGNGNVETGVHDSKKELFPTSIGTVDLFDFDAVNAALNLVAEYCRARLGLHQLYCTIAETNHPSRALFEKAGFQISGRLKSWLRTPPTYTSAYFYQKFL